MESLLRWGIENSARDESASSNHVTPEARRDLDPAILDAILGRPDSELMKDALAIAVDDRRSEEQRLLALDDFEMLIEQIDNANNITNMKMWTPLSQLLSTPGISDEIKANTLWIIGTAIQNNPSAQDAYLSHSSSSVSSILSHVSSPSESAKTRSKAVYALSALLKHNHKAVSSLEELDGWTVLKEALQDSDITVRRKAAFLLNTLLLPSILPSSQNSSSEAGPVHANTHASMTAESTETSKVTASALQRHGIMDTVVKGLVNPLPHGNDGENDGDIDFTEKLVRLLFTYVTDSKGELGDDQKTEIRDWLQQQKEQREVWDLGQDEFGALMQALA